MEFVEQGIGISGLMEHRDAEFEDDGPLRVVTAHQGDGVVVALAGDLDLSTAPSLLRRLQALVCLPIESLTLDLRDLAFLDSTGVSTLIEARRSAREHHVALRLVGLPDQARQVLDLTGVLELFDIAD